MVETAHVDSDGARLQTGLDRPQVQSSIWFVAEWDVWGAGAAGPRGKGIRKASTDSVRQEQVTGDN